MLPTPPAAAPPARPVLAGTLSVDADGRGPPVLELVVTCPHCKGRGRHHEHSWPVSPDDDFDQFTPQPRASHCVRRTSPFYGAITAYMIVPAPTRQNRNIFNRWCHLVNEYRRSSIRKAVRQSRILELKVPTTITTGAAPMAQRYSRDDLEELAEVLRGRGLTIPDEALDMPGLSGFVIAVKANPPLGGGRRDRRSSYDDVLNLDTDVVGNLMSDHRARFRRN